MRVKTGLISIAAAVLAALLALPAGCGRFIDKDLIKVARVDGKYITRGELAKLIRDMSDEERPKIRNRNDSLRVLNQYIDDSLKIPFGAQLEKEGKITVPVETAREAYFAGLGDEAESRRNIWNMEVPANGESTPLMQVYGLTPEGLQAMKDTIAEEVENTRKKILGDQAVQYYALELAKAGKIKLTEDEVQREYRIRKDTLRKPEWVKFAALAFFAAVEGAPTRAAKVRDRVNAGENFDTIAAEYQSLQQSAVVRPEEKNFQILVSEIENNPNSAQFRGFWQEVSGAEPGKVFGPIYMPPFQQIMEETSGKRTPIQCPESYMVVKVLEHRPETQLTYEECNALLRVPLAIAKAMEEIRKDHGVEIYEDQIQNPLSFSEGVSPDGLN